LKSRDCWSLQFDHIPKLQSICLFIALAKVSFWLGWAKPYHKVTFFLWFQLPSWVYLQLIFHNLFSCSSFALIQGQLLVIFLEIFHSNHRFISFCQYIHRCWSHQFRIIWSYPWEWSLYERYYFVVVQSLKENLAFLDSFFLCLHNIAIHFDPFR
jgi:hypothetical protein